MNAPVTQILIVEDDSAIAQALESEFSLRGFPALVASTCERARHVIEAVPLRAMILDLGLPDGDGLELLDRLHEQPTPPPAIIMTARDALGDRVRGLDLGADDYIVKPFAFEELLARLRAVLRRTGTLDHPDRCGGLERRPDDPRFFQSGVPLALSPREHALLVILWNRRERLVSKVDLLQELDPSGNEIADAAIEVYVHRLRKKLETTGVTISTLRGFGYLLQAERSGVAD